MGENLKKLELLDCTLRDGGYYTNWDFDSEIAKNYFKAFNELPVDYLEVGYRSIPMGNYLGAYFYCPTSLLESIKEQSNKKLVIILNEKDVRPEHLNALLMPCKGLIDMVRVAIDPKNIGRALILAEEIKKFGYEVGFNVMYMSNWKSYSGFYNELKNVNGLADYFYMVDSFGGIYPEEIRNIYASIKTELDVKIGFHGHNNLELGLINTLTAIDAGVDIVDSTVTGMGRGAGNLKTELLLTALNSKHNLPVNFNALSEVVDDFESLQNEFKWGTNLPYMVSGANSLPQKDVMEWVTKRYYSFNSIIRALYNKKDGKKDNKQLNEFKPVKSYSKSLIIGGGNSVMKHRKAILEFLAKQDTEDFCIIHASSKNAKIFLGTEQEQFYCLVGSEGHRLEKVFDSELSSVTCILPPFPRKMGTYIPKAAKATSFELTHSEIDYHINDTHTILALQTAFELGINEAYLVGYDGYPNESITSKEHELFIENQQIFDSVRSRLRLISLLPTTYGVDAQSVYSFLA